MTVSFAIANRISINSSFFFYKDGFHVFLEKQKKKKCQWGVRCWAQWQYTDTNCTPAAVRILASVLTVLWMDFSMALWEVMFSLVAIAMLNIQERKTEKDTWFGGGEKAQKKKAPITVKTEETAAVRKHTTTHAHVNEWEPAYIKSFYTQRWESMSLQPTPLLWASGVLQKEVKVWNCTSAASNLRPSLFQGRRGAARKKTDQTPRLCLCPRGIWNTHRMIYGYSSGEFYGVCSRKSPKHCRSATSTFTQITMSLKGNVQVPTRYRQGGWVSEAMSWRWMLLCIFWCFRSRYYVNRSRYNCSDRESVVWNNGVFIVQQTVCWSTLSILKAKVNKIIHVFPYFLLEMVSNLSPCR